MRCWMLDINMYIYVIGMFDINMYNYVIGIYCCLFGNYIIYDFSLVIKFFKFKYKVCVILMIWLNNREVYYCEVFEEVLIWGDC